MPDEINPPAIVKEAEADCSLNELAEGIRDDHGHMQRHFGHGLEFAKRIGDKIIRAKKRLPHGKLKPWIEKNCDFGYRQAAKYARIAREWDKLPKVNSGSLLNAQENVNLSVEDAPPGELAEDGTVPFSPGATNGKTPDREPGADDSYQELLAKKQEVLCPRCKRLKSPGCDQCRVKWFRLDNPKTAAEGEAAATKAKPPKHKEDPKNGTPLFDWEGYRKDLTCFNKRLNSFGHAYQCLETGVLEKARDKLLEAHDEFRKAYEQVTKQKVPNWTFLEKVKV